MKNDGSNDEFFRFQTGDFYQEQIVPTGTIDEDGTYKITGPLLDNEGKIPISGQGLLYNATTLESKEVVIKISRDAEDIILSEAKLLHCFEHERLVRVLHTGKVKKDHPFAGRRFMVLQKLRGSCMSQEIAKGHPCSWWIPRFLQILEGGIYIQDKGYIHGDYKPDNVYLDDVQGVKVLDFGLTVQYGPSPIEHDLCLPTIKQTKGKFRPPGTKGYLPHEASAPEDSLHPRIDVFAIGVMLYRAVQEGRFPYKTGKNNVCTGEQIPIKNEEGRLPPELIEIIQRAIHQDPEKRYQNLREFYEALAKLGRAAEMPEVSPFLALAPYTESNACHYNGRKEDTKELLAMVQQAIRQAQGPRLIAVIGPSGVGKSSLVGAGLIPALGKLDKKIECKMMRPEDNPEGQMMSLGIPIDGEFVFVVDQFEQLYYRCTPAARSDFFRCLNNQILERPGRVLVVTVRSDSLEEINRDDPEFGYWISQFNRVLGPPSEENLLEIITKPFEKHNQVLPKAVTYRILARTNGYLPGLSYYMAEFWKAVRQGRDPLEIISELGAIDEILGNRAEAVYAALSKAEQDVAKQAFIRLIHFREGLGVHRRRAGISELGNDPALKKVLGHFADARLLTMDGAKRGESTTKDMDYQIYVEIPHDAVLQKWKTLKDWIDESKSDLPKRQRLLEATFTWVNSNRDVGWLWGGNELVELRDLVGRIGFELTAAEWEFYRCCEDHQQRMEEERLQAEENQRAAGKAWGAVTMLVVAGLIAAFVKYVVDKKEAQETAYQESTRNHIAKDQLRTLAWVGELVEMGISTSAVRHMANTATLSADSLQSVLHHGDVVSSAEFSPDGSRLVTGSYDRTVRIWDVHAGMLSGVLSGHFGEVESVHYRHDGKMVVSAGQDRLVIIWDPIQSKVLHILRGHEEKLLDAIFSPDGTQVLSLSKDGTARLWDVASGQMLFSYNHGKGLLRAQFGPSGSWFMTVGGGAKLWGTKSGTMIQEVAAENAAIVQIAISKSGWVALASTLPNIGLVVFDPRTGKVAADVKHDGIVNDSSLWFDDTESRLRIASTGRVDRWDWQEHSTSRTSEENKLQFEWGSMRSGEWAWAKSTKELLFARGQSRAKVSNGYIGNTVVELGRWHENRWRSIALHGHEQGVRAVAFSPDGKLLVSASEDRTARIWSLRRIVAEDPLVIQGKFSRFSRTYDENSILVGDALGGSLFDIRTAKALRRFEHANAMTYASEYLHRRVLTASEDQIFVWDAESDKSITRIVPGGKVRFVGDALKGRVIYALVEDPKLGQGFRSWETETGTIYFENFGVYDKGPLVADLSSNQKILAIGSQDSESTDRWIQFVDLEERRLLQRISTEGVSSLLKLSPDGNQVFVVSVDRVYRWDRRPWHRSIPFEGHTADIRSMDLSPDGSHLTTCGMDGTIRSWDASTGGQIFVSSMEATGGCTVEYDRSGERILAQGLLYARILDSRTGAELEVFSHMSEQAKFSRMGDRAILLESDEGLTITPPALDRRNEKEFAKLIECRVPFEISGKKLHRRIPPRCAL